METSSTGVGHAARRARRPGSSQACPSVTKERPAGTLGTGLMHACCPSTPSSIRLHLAAFVATLQPTPASSLAHALGEVHERLRAAASAGGSAAAAPRLLAVTKNISSEQALALVQAGQLDLGENRVDQLEAKAAALAGAGVRWHFIGHIQRNKARRVVALADTIHSVDSARLLESIQHHATELERAPGLFLQLNLTGEGAKQGLGREQLHALLGAPPPGPCPLLGLMTMAPLDDEDGSGARRVFGEVAQLARDISADDILARRFAAGPLQLSMGMSRDLEQAVAAGSHWVRLGRAIFPSAAADSTPSQGAARSPGDNK